MLKKRLQLKKITLVPFPQGNATQIKFRMKGNEFRFASTQIQINSHTPCRRNSLRAKTSIDSAQVYTGEYPLKQSLILSSQKSPKQKPCRTVRARTASVPCKSIIIPQQRLEINHTPRENLIKADIVQRIKEKINFIKKMTPQTQYPPQNSIFMGINLFKFDKLYDHCIRNVTKSLKLQQRNCEKKKGISYKKLKLQNEIYSKQLKQMRESLVKRKKKEDNKEEFDVVGNTKKIQKYSAPKPEPRPKRNRYEPLFFFQPKIEIKCSEPEVKGWELRPEKINDLQTL